MDPEPGPDGSLIAIYVIVLVLLILLSAFFSATETAFTSLNRARLKTRAGDGNKKAEKVLSIVDDFDKILFTLLIGNNIVNITATTIATLLFIEIIAAAVAPTVSTVVLTVVVLVFGEILPKTFAKQYPERYAEFSYPLVRFFMVVLFPLSAVFSGLIALVKKVFKFREEEGINEEELLNIVEEAGEGGGIDEEETELISSAIEFHDAEAGDILIPRVNVVAVPVDMPMEKIKQIFFTNAYSRMPVYSETIDKIIGMIHERDFFVALDRGEKNISHIIKKTAIATEHMKISTLLKSMQKQKVHLAVVVDEYGGTLGIVTMEDILEELVGEIWDEHDEVVNYFEKVSPNTYLVDGNADLGDFFELFSIETEEDEFDSQTVGGWVLEKTGELPKKNTSFEFEHLQIILTKCSVKRVFEIKVVVNDKSVAEKVNEEYDSSTESS
ncbi:MAG: HlyC/CorC family transporter [Clostridia bacterium]|nr:HlyC/CorC family transporter [Clostridia bacterium]